MRHHFIEGISSRQKLVALVHQPCGLAHVVGHEGHFNETPGDPDVLSSAMTEIRVERLSSCCCQEDSAKQPEPVRIVYEQLIGILWAQRLNDIRKVYDLACADNEKRCEPQHHDRTKCYSDFGC